jgi:flagellar biogenesis protein FliO
VDLTQQLTVAALFMAALLALVAVLKRRGLVGVDWPAAKPKQRRMKTVERLALTPSHSLHMVDVDGRTLIIGVSPAGCHLLEKDVRA